jgi:hypothetical protein
MTHANADEIRIPHSAIRIHQNRTFSSSAFSDALREFFHSSSVS